MGKQLKKNQHIAVYVGITIFVGFFWVLPATLDLEPAVIVSDGLNHFTATLAVVKNALVEFTATSAELVTAIGALAAIVYSFVHFGNK